MTYIDLNPVYRNREGLDRLASLFDNKLQNNQLSTDYPPYNIEMHDENHYTITLAVAGYTKDELELEVEKNVLTIKADKATVEETDQYLHMGIANQPFESRFNLADYVEVTGAALNNGLLTVNLLKEIPEAMKPKTIKVETGESTVLEHQGDPQKDTSE